MKNILGVAFPREESAGLLWFCHVRDVHTDSWVEVREEGHIYKVHIAARHTYIYIPILSAPNRLQ